MWRRQARKRTPSPPARAGVHVIHTCGLLTPFFITRTPLASRLRSYVAPAGLSSSREMVEAPAVVVVRAYDDNDARDHAGVEEVERACEVGCMSGGGKMCLFTDLLGDPLCRIRHSPDSLMLVRIHDHVRAARSPCLLCLYTHVVVVPGWGLRAGCG